MRFPRIRLERKALTASPSVLEAARDGASFYPRLGGTNINTQKIGSVFVQAQSASYAHMYRTQPAVRSVVDYLARNIAQLGLKVYRRVSDDEREHVGDHPAAVSLRQPNGYTPGQQLIKTFVSDFFIYDNAYMLKFRGEGLDRITVINIPAHAVGILGRQRYQAEGYRVYLADGSFFDVAPEDMIHWRGYNPEDPRAGVSLLETLRQELAADATARTAKTELDKAGLMPMGWIERPVDAAEWSLGGQERFVEGWANAMKAQQRKTPVLEEGMVFKQAGVSPENAQMLESRQFVAAQVAAAFGMCGVPPENEEERRQVYSDVLPPFCEMLCSYLDLQVLQAEYFADDYYFAFNLDEKQMSDDRIKTLTNAAGAPIMLRDEARARLDLPALPDGQGREMVTPLNVSEGGKPSVGAMPVQDPNKPPQDGSHREEPKALEPAHAERWFLNRKHGPAEEITEILHRLYRRQEKAGRWDKAAQKRFRQELHDELLPFSEVPNRRVKDLAFDLNAVVWEALQTTEPAQVFRQAHERAPRMAAVLAEELQKNVVYGPGLVAQLGRGEHPALADPSRLSRLRALREDLGVPDEYAWQLAGFTDEEIDAMTAMAHSADLLASTDAG